MLRGAYAEAPDSEGSPSSICNKGLESQDQVALKQVLSAKKAHPDPSPNWRSSTRVSASKFAKTERHPGKCQRSSKHERCTNMNAVNICVANTHPSFRQCLGLWNVTHGGLLWPEYVWQLSRLAPTKNKAMNRLTVAHGSQKDSH